MKRASFDAFCAGLPGAGNVVQWGGASVWKVGGAEAGKVFAIHSDWGEDGGVVLKPNEMAREIWRDAPGVEPAPYLGRAGWIKIAPGAMSSAELKDLVLASYEINAAKLTKAKRREFGIAT